MKKTFLVFALFIILPSACATPTEPAPIATAAHPSPASTPTPENTQTPPANSPQPTLSPPALREIPALYPPMVSLPFEGCPFAGSTEIETLIGTLERSPASQVTFLPPYYEHRASIRCEARSQTNRLFLDLWFAPDAESAQRDFDEVQTLTEDEALPVTGLGEAAFWWQRGLRLEVISGDTRLTLALADSMPDAAHQTALLAAHTMNMIQPASGLSQPEPIRLPIGAPEPKSVHVRDLAPQGEFFNACSLLTEEDYETAFGALEYPLVSGGGIGELEAYETYDCVTNPLEPGGWMYLSIVFGNTPGDMILNYKRGAVVYPANATRMDNLGDEAWYWYSPDGTNLNLSVLRGNVNLVLNVLMQDGYENRGKLRSLARLMLDRLFEQSN